MNEPFAILWSSIILIIIIRIYLWMKIKNNLNKEDDGYQFFSTISSNIILGVIPQIQNISEINKLYRDIFNKLTIVLYISLFANFILLFIDNLN